MNYRWILHFGFGLISLLLYLTSCQTKTKKAGDNAEATIQTEIVEEALPSPTPNRFDHVAYFAYIENVNKHTILSKEELTKLGVDRFFPTIENFDSWYLVDSISLSDNFSTYIFIHDIDEKDQLMYMTNYDKQMELTDSRLIYQTTIYDQDTFDEVYSVLSPESNKLISYKRNNFLDQIDEIPISIDSEGKFENFPDLEYITDSIAVGASMGYGFDGKFPLGEEWSVLCFKENIVGNTDKYGKVKVYKTLQHSLDHISNTITLITDPISNPQNENEYLFIDIAFKGIYKNEDFEILKLTEEPLKENQEIVELILKETPNNEFSEPHTTSISNLQSYMYQGEKFWLASHSSTVEKWNTTYTALIGVTPDMKVVKLAEPCIYETMLFRLKDQIMIYTESTSCGEGAYGTTYLYTLDNKKFNKKYEYGMGYD